MIWPALLDALKINEPIVFCGLSMGGYVAWQFALRHRARLAKLILVRYAGYRRFCRGGGRAAKDGRKSAGGGRKRSGRGACFQSYLHRRRISSSRKLSRRRGK